MLNPHKTNFYIRFKKTCLALALGFGFINSSVAADAVIATEKQLLAGLTALNQLQIEQAVAKFAELGHTNPKYKLAHLIKADLLSAKSGQGHIMASMHERHRKDVDKLLSEAEVRWQFANVAFTTKSGFDDFVLKSAEQKHIMVVNLQKSRLYLYERDANKQMKQVVDYYVTIGRKGSGKEREGDLRTPIGVYHLVDLLPGDTLPDLYGVGALPLNYPNEWDRKNGKTGSGIWLHGVPSNTYIRPPKSTRGCVVLSNDAMEKLLSKYDLPFSTPIIIADEKASDFGFVENKHAVLDGVQAWLKDNEHKVDWDKVSVYRYPSEKNLFYVTFPSGKGKTLVHQFWEKDMQGYWKVVLESHDTLQSSSKKPSA